jgi:glyoxylase-like metal-dependent hydrolase (beta-lactamase superfamily II)
MPAFICTTCGVQHAESLLPPEQCAICEDERQYVGLHGQRWTTLDDLRRNHANVFRPKWPDLSGIGTEPTFAIGQRALLVRDAGYPLLWDCLTLIDDATVGAIRAAGGIRAIAISHPHYYGAMVEWARAFDVPVYLHEADREWVMRPDPALVFWSGDLLRLADGMTLIRCGGHFPGGTVLHWSQGAGGRGTLFTGDIIAVNQDRKTVTFMYSYPNYIPLPAATVERIAAAVEPYEFDQIYGAFWDRNILQHGKEAVRYSARRYVSALASEK